MDDFKVETRANGTIDVSDGRDHWLTFTLDDLRKEVSNPRVDMICGGMILSPEDALEFILVGHAMAKHFAIKEGLIPPR